MANWIYSGRRSGRTLRSRHESEDEVRLDFCKDANDNTREILTNVCKREGLTEGKRFNYLNEFVKLLIKLEGPGGLDYSIEELQCCLRVALIHEASLVRAAALRAVRYLLKEEKDVRILNRLGFPALICRSLDLVLRNDMERVQALQLVRRMLLLAPTDVAPSIVRSLVSLANSGTEEKDRMLRPCLAVLSEICILNPEMFISCGGVGAVLSGLQDNQMPRITEALCGVLLCLLNSPVTRSKAGISLQSLASPYCDFRLYTDRNREERENLFYCSKLALLSILRSWPGILHFCHPANSSGLKSLVNILYLNQLDVRKGILDLLYDLLGLPQPEWTDEFSVALEAIDPSHPRDSWKLQDGFISAEGKDVLPHLAKYRPNIVEMHLALLLYTFVEAGLLEAIVEVIVSSDTYISVRATVLLGELLYLIHKLLPPECCNLTPALPNLLSYASDPSVPCTQNLALAAVAALARLHTMLKRRPAPASLFLDRTLQAGGWSRTSKRSKLFMFVAPKENDDLLKESGVLIHKDGFSWNWNIVRTVLKNRSEALKKLEDSNHRMFLRRLVHYFKPSSNRFSRVELGNKKQTQMYTLAGLELIDCLLEADEAEGSKLLTELVSDICTQIEAMTSSRSAHECLFSPQHVSNSMCQDYFLFIGRLCRCSKGSRVLDKTGIYQELLHLVGSTNHDCYIKLVVSGLDYSQDAMPRAILSKVLTAAYESARLYATQFLLVLLRAKLPDFEKWGIELLVMQLYDKSKAVSLAAIHVLEEAAEEKTYLDAIISLRPSLLHLGDKGLLLLIRFLSTPNGFTFLHDANFVTTQLERWSVTYNYRYVRLVEGEIHSSLTLHQRDEDGRYSRHISNVKPSVRDVYIPPHLYGQLVQHERGFQLLLKEGKLRNLFQNVCSECYNSEQDELELKASIWGCGHIGTSPLGISYLVENGIIHSLVQLAQNCPIYSIRATAFYALGLIATTYEGANHLNKCGWVCVRHHRQDRWPVIQEENSEPEEVNEMCEVDNISVSSQLTAAARSSVDSRRDSNLGRFYIPGDDDVDSAASGDDEAAAVASANWPLESGTNSDTSLQKQKKSQTLPHQRSAKSQAMLARHVRSHSECKQTNDNCGPIIQTTGWTFSTSRTRRDSGRGDQETKSRSNSCTDSSGVSSCDSGVGVVNKHEQTLSPIPSSTTLNTTNINQVVFRRRMSSMNESITSDSMASPEPTNCYLSQQDITGYATLRSLYQYRRPLYSVTASLAAMEFLVFYDNDHSSQSVSRALKVRSLDRHSIHPGMCEFEASLPPQLPSGASSLPLAAHAYIGSRSNLAAVKPSARETSGLHQCYMGICLPRDLKCLYPTEEAVDVFEDYDNRRSNANDMSHDKGEGDMSSSSDSEDLESQIKTYQSGADASQYHHVSVNCLACCRLRDRKISTSSYHRSRTDTESSYGGGESPVLLPKRRKSYSTSICLLGITPGGSVESGNSASLDTGSCNQRLEEAGTPSKASIRKEILKHVVRMSNPVWIKLSKQSLLQLKEKFPAAFQDVCLYSEVSHQMGSATYRISARRFLQELFLDLQFDILYEEPAAILQMQPSGTEGGSLVGIGSPQSTDLSSSLPASPNVSANQDIREKMSLEACLVSSPGCNPSSHESTSIGEIELENLSKTLDMSARVSVLQGTYTVKSPPLEVVKEESVASVSHLDTLSEQSLLSNSSTLFVSARNDVLISAIMSDSPVSCVNQVVIDKYSSQLASKDESLAVSVALVTATNSPALDCYKLQSSSRTNSAPLKGKEEIRSDLTVNFSLTDINCDKIKTPDKRRMLNSSVLLEGGAEQGREVGSIKVLKSGTECIWQDSKDSVSPAGIRQRKMATTHAPKLSSLSTDNTVPSSKAGSEEVS